MPSRGIAAAAVAACALVLAGLAPSARAAARVPLIVGGEPARAGEMPSLAFVVYRIPNGREEAIVCTGSVVAPRFVLTAAHCLHSPRVHYDVANFVIVTGTPNWKDRRRETSEVVATYDDPLYGRFGGGHDAALLELAAPVGAPSLPLARRRVWAPGDAVEMVGWGSAHVRQHHATYLLRHAPAIVLPTDECREAGAWVGEICTLAPRPRKATTCYGDSGAPLLMRRPRDHRWIAVGLVRGGQNCNPRRPAFYTPVPSIAHWAYAQMARARQSPISSMR